MAYKHMWWPPPWPFEPPIHLHKWYDPTFAWMQLHSLSLLNTPCISCMWSFGVKLKDSDVVNVTFENIWFGLYDALGMRIVVIFWSVGDEKMLGISPKVKVHDKTSKILKARLTT